MQDSSRHLARIRSSPSPHRFLAQGFSGHGMGCGGYVGRGALSVGSGSGAGPVLDYNNIVCLFQDGKNPL